MKTESNLLDSLKGLALPLAALLAFAVLGPVAASADDTAAELQYIVVSDDIQKEVTETARAAGSGSGDGADANANADGTGKTNNGHGNNADGVDVSNPGEGGGGPNGMDDPSGTVDDEAGGGGAAPSKGKGKDK